MRARSAEEFAVMTQSDAPVERGFLRRAKVALAFLLMGPPVVQVTVGATLVAAIWTKAASEHRPFPMSIGDVAESFVVGVPFVYAVGALPMVALGLIFSGLLLRAEFGAVEHGIFAAGLATIATVAALVVDRLTYGTNSGLLGWAIYVHLALGLALAAPILAVLVRRVVPPRMVPIAVASIGAAEA